MESDDGCGKGWTLYRGMAFRYTYPWVDVEEWCIHNDVGMYFYI